VSAVEADPSARVAHQGSDVRYLAAADLAHHLARLAELLDQPTDVLNGRARAARDPQPARALDQLGPVTSSGVIERMIASIRSSSRSSTFMF